MNLAKEELDKWMNTNKAMVRKKQMKFTLFIKTVTHASIFSAGIPMVVDSGHTTLLIAELVERSPIIIQNSSNPSSRKNLDVRPYDRPYKVLLLACTANCTTYLIISPLHGNGEVANENPLILPRTLSIVGALVLLKRRAGKKCELRF